MQEQGLDAKQVTFDLGYKSTVMVYDTITNRFGNDITGSVVHVNALGEGKADVHIETAYHIEAGINNPARYNMPSYNAPGHYWVDRDEWTDQQTYVYRGVFERESV